MLDIHSCFLTCRGLLSAVMEGNEYTAAHGYEILMDANTMDAYSASFMAQRLKALKRRCGFLTFHAPFFDLSPGGLDMRIRQVSHERLLQMADVANLVVPANIVVHTGYTREMYGHGKMYHHWKHHVCDILHRLLEQLNPSVTISVENVFEADPAPLVDVVSAVNNPRLGYCLDVGHSRLFGQTSHGQWIEAFAEKLFEVHLHDNHGVGDDHLPCGQGNIDFSAILEALDQHDLQPILTFEVLTEAAFQEAVLYLEQLNKRAASGG